ncbi:MAG: hypothetical protein HC794_06060 [Nitrospiraceae bacterium]|nr:hypothetical protein [Nitrospiraceae bacterium]
MTSLLQKVGAQTLDQFRGWGHALLFFLDVLRAVPASLRRFDLVVVQIYAIGNRSLIIIMASGLAVGFVLALQMYYALVAYGAAESLGLIVNLALVRELGGEVLITRGDDIVTALLQLAHQRNITQMVVGKPGRQPGWAGASGLRWWITCCAPVVTLMCMWLPVKIHPAQPTGLAHPGSLILPG